MTTNHHKPSPLQRCGVELGKNSREKSGVCELGWALPVTCIRSSDSLPGFKQLVLLLLEENVRCLNDALAEFAGQVIECDEIVWGSIRSQRKLHQQVVQTLSELRDVVESLPEVSP